MQARCFPKPSNHVPPFSFPRITPIFMFRSQKFYIKIFLYNELCRDMYNIVRVPFLQYCHWLQSMSNYVNGVVLPSEDKSLIFPLFS